MQYADCMLQECNILLNIYLSKPMVLYDLCFHIDYRDSVNKDDFNKLILPDYSPQVRADMVTFQNKMDERTDLLYAQILVANEMYLY